MTARWSSFAVSSGVVHTSLGKIMRTGFGGRCSSGLCDALVMSNFVSAG